MQKLFKLRFFFAVLAALFLSFSANAQAVVNGTVTDGKTQEALPSVAVTLLPEGLKTVTNASGQFRFANVKPGLHNLQFSSLGYKSRSLFEIQALSTRPTELQVVLEPSSTQLEEVKINAQAAFVKDAQSPVSVQSIGINEIQRNPGGNQDISKVIQSLPGVASGLAFRNDLFIRGGGPNENRFFLDGIEIPAINHFATQGASGGPVGMINVNLIRDVDFYTSAFQAQRGNTLSSVMEINLKDGRTDRTGGLFQVGASEVGLFLEGPLSKKTTYLVSARRSYLQFLFGVLGLPFLPSYNDYQFKVKHQLGKRSSLTVLSLGAYDVSTLNTTVDSLPAQRYILSYLPEYFQWNYSIGAKYTQGYDNGYLNVILSRFMLNNTAQKFVNNDKNADKLLDYASQEIENKLRVERIFKGNTSEGTVGFGLEQAKYNTQTFDKRLPGGVVLDYTNQFTLYKYSLFAQWAGRFADERLKLSLGFRTDGNGYNDYMRNPLNGFSPRAAFSYYLNERWTVDANWGIYKQLPPYTTLGYKDRNGVEANRDNLKFMQATHYVLGTTQFWPWSAKTSVEGFYKDYRKYPFLTTDQISLANLGGDFGVIGNQPATSTSNGRAYGVEFTYQQKLYKGWFGIAAITAFRSLFEDKNGELLNASWDNRMIATFTLGKKFAKNWELGMQYQHLGGAPYTPFDADATALRSNWDVLGRSVVDYSRLNTLRNPEFDRLNVRVDKKWYLKKSYINLYFDVQNVLASKIVSAPFIDVQRDAAGAPIVYPNDPTRYLTTELENASGTVLPSIGFIFGF